MLLSSIVNAHFAPKNLVIDGNLYVFPVLLQDSRSKRRVGFLRVMQELTDTSVLSVLSGRLKMLIISPGWR
jgi:hypothetical protein